jgi:hypothetical protein
MLLRDQFIREMTDELTQSTGLGFKMGDAWKSIFHQRTTDKRRVEMQSFVWPSTVAPTEEGGALNRLTVNHGFGSFVVPLTYTGEVKISHEFMRDLRYEEVKKEAFGLGVAFQRNRYNLACDTLINGFGSVLGPDSQPLFSQSHVLAANSSPSIPASNQLIGAPLNTDNFDAAISLLMSTPDENGDVYPITPTRIRLITVPQLQRQAYQIAGSEYEPETANNAINIYSGQYDKFQIEVVILPLLYGRAPSAWRASQWYVQLPEYHELYFYEREAVETWMVQDTNSLSVLYQGLDAFGFLINGWRFMVGAKGI